MIDKRYELVHQRLSTLTKEQLQRIIDNIDRVCLDTFNFDVQEKTFCPLAVAHNLHETLVSPTDILVKQELSKNYSPVNILKGTPGDFYTTNRKQDLLNLCHALT